MYDSDYSSDVLDYYAVCAEVLGRASERNAGARRAPGMYHADDQAAYSISWFYTHFTTHGCLNRLSRAFLGDADALFTLSFGEAPRASFASALLEGAYPLNESQIRAIASALSSDVSLIQGPPGTGKTETILNLVSCVLARGKTAAVVANNGQAIRNIEEKVRAWGTDSEAGANQRRLAGAYARLGNRDARLAWVAAHPDSPQRLRFTGQQADRRGQGDATALPGWEAAVRATEFLERWPFITSTIHSLKKCFADGASYQYDYVIMDEASQCSPLLGLVAMSSAKHLVLVGDDQQLPPIVSDAAQREIEAELARRDIEPLSDDRYALIDPRTRQGRSVLSVVRSVLSTYCVPNTLLNEHYRCHPGIIGFCNEYIYAPSGMRLAIKTPDYNASVQTPIRVRWYEGNYCERCFVEEQGREGGVERRASRTNPRQLDIFFTEEWPLLKARQDAGEQLDFCVLAPYRGVLDAFAQRAVREGMLSAEEVHAARDAEDCESEDPLAAASFPALTVHKSQGKEYDIVYLLPGEDGAWEWPWTEAKPFINVAVSRAKKELVIIASSELMSESTRAALMGAGDGASAGRGCRVPGESELFFQKLIDYVRDRNDSQRHPDAPRGFPESDYAFGFHRAAGRSVSGGKAVQAPAGASNAPAAGEHAADACQNDIETATAEHVHHDLPSITTLLAAWRKESDEAVEQLAGVKPADVNELLKKAGYLEGSKGSWRVTSAGKKFGIVESEERLKRAKGGTDTFVAIRYTPQAAEAVRRLLRERRHRGRTNSSCTERSCG